MQIEFSKLKKTHTEKQNKKQIDVILISNVLRRKSEKIICYS